MDKLSKIKMNKSYLLNGFTNSLPLKLKRRLLDLGFTRGEKVVFCNKSLLGKTYLVQIRGVMLSLRDQIVKGLILE